VTIYDGCGSLYFGAFHELEGNYTRPLQHRRRRRRSRRAKAKPSRAAPSIAGSIQTANEKPGSKDGLIASIY
jgi:hypothetical protein